MNHVRTGRWPVHEPVQTLVNSFISFCRLPQGKMKCTQIPPSAPKKQLDFIAISSCFLCFFACFCLQKFSSQCRIFSYTPSFTPVGPYFAILTQNLAEKSRRRGTIITKGPEQERLFLFGGDHRVERAVLLRMQYGMLCLMANSSDANSGSQTSGSS